MRGKRQWSSGSGAVGAELSRSYVDSRVGNSYGEENPAHEQKSLSIATASRILAKRGEGYTNRIMGFDI